MAVSANRLELLQIADPVASCVLQSVGIRTSADELPQPLK